MTRVVGIRGATTVEADALEEILDATQDLLVRLQELNGFDPDDVASILFSTTQDLRSTFPARAARRLGWVQVPMLCTHEVDAPASVARCIRVLIHWNTDKPARDARHAYLRGSRVLRPDWAIPPLAGPAGAVTAPEDPLREVANAAGATQSGVAVTGIVEATPAAFVPRSEAAGAFGAANDTLADLTPLVVQPVAFQGEPGAYSQEAIFGIFGAQTICAPCPGFRGAFEAVHHGRAKSALLPVENSTTGSVHEVWDLMLQHDLVVAGEVILPVRHALLGLPGATLADIKTVMSHPQALFQCEGWIGTHGWTIEPGTDTAGSARRIAEAKDKTRAAIASAVAAELYGLEVLAKNIQDVAENYTRFFLLVPRAAFVSGAVAPGFPRGPRAAAGAGAPGTGNKLKTSIVFATRHTPGSLYGCLAEFAVRDLSLTKIESRPDRRTPWNYIFFVDFEGDPAEPRTAQALAGVARHASFVRVLGTYPSRSLGD